MKRKIVSWLAFMAIFLLSLQSCVYDEMYSSPDYSKKEYQSKSLWKEDEKYIKNVMKIYTKHEKDIHKPAGVPDWDYAMSMGKYDESFMVVPIVENGKVVNTLVCGHFYRKVYFRYENSKINNEFFQKIMFGKYAKYKTETPDNTKTGEQKGMVCITKSVSMWYPDNESNPNANGHWETSYYTNCYNFLDYSSPGWEDDGGGGYDYDGGGGNGNTDPNNSENQDPCEKTKGRLNNPKMQPGLQELKNQSTIPKTDPNYGEKGIKFKADGTPSATINGSAHSVNFGDKTGYQGGYHNHTEAGIPMLSPPDIDQLLQFALAQGNGSSIAVGNAYVGMIAPNGMHYIIQFNGIYQDALITFTDETLQPFKDRYQTRYGMISSGGTVGNEAIERFFFKTVKDMGLEGKINLQRVESDGTIKTIVKNTDGSTTAIPCP
ncbi:hypothetical protein [uncultured Chryseobacterium sp.]|uniref:hypothetical protein n=1 Tax=uncultured Chryseobacterium sp. TaxID=259322 RepID=UPI0025F5292F|nr:hypothetical protein [uncultured Chryseobacterium sp.]